MIKCDASFGTACISKLVVLPEMLIVPSIIKILPSRTMPDGNEGFTVSVAVR